MTRFFLAFTLVLTTWQAAAQAPSLVFAAQPPTPSAGPAAPPPAFSQLTAAGNLLFFVLETASRPRQLWRADGTGPIPLTSDPAAPPLDLFAGWQGSLYFRRGGGSQLWRSDGTVSGTALLKDIGQGFGAPAISEIFAASNGLFLNADDGNGPTTWFSDGTAAGTRPLVQGLAYNDIPSQPAGFTELAGRVYITGGAPQGVWVTQGTPGTTKRLAVLDTTSISKPVAAAGAIFFTAGRGDTGEELWRTDGTLGGETLVRDIVAGPQSSHPAQLTAGGPYLYFVADDGTHGQELWRTDGTAAGTVLVKDIAPGMQGSAPAHLTTGMGVLYFSADDGTHGVELWQSDGTPEGTILVADIEPGIGSSNPKELMFTHGTLFFAASDALHGEELRHLDGGYMGDLSDWAPGPASSSPAEMTLAGSLLYFSMTATGELSALQPYGGAFSLDDTRIIEGNDGTRVARLTVTRSKGVNVDSVVFRTVDGSAVSGTDYVPRSGTLTFTSGQASQFIDITINSDSDLEPNEAFFVTLSDDPAILWPPTLIDRATGTVILEDDDRPVLNTPLNVQATALSSKVNVTWTAAASADRYDVVRIDRGHWSALATVTGTSFVDTQDVIPGRTYLYTVRAYDAAGNTIGYGAADLVTTILFDDDPIVVRGTPVRRVHIEQLQAAADSLRWFADNVEPPSITPVPTPPGAPIRASDILDLRIEFTALRRRLGLPDIAWTDATLTTVKAVHVQELRDAVR